uniref:Putative cnidarian restricted secerted protein n=1 Tax=Clytia hemisphaerica TaxID=252671 RepID=A0A069DMR6_9CNID
MKLFISLILFTILLNFIECRIRLNAKEIEKNFDGIHQEIVEIKKNLQYYLKRINTLDGKSRNDTVIYNKLVQRLNHLRYELDRIKEIQQRELKEKLHWKAKAENNSRLIYDFKLGLQNKINQNQNLLTKRIERLEQQYLYGHRSILNLEEKIGRETIKNQRLSSELQMLKSSIRQVYNNMTASINKLRRKHDWMANRIFNKSVENTETMRHFQRYAEELQQQIFALQKRASTEEKEAPFRLKDMLMSLLYESEKSQKISTTVKTAEPSTASVTATTTQTTLPTTTTLRPTTLKPTTTTTTTTTTKKLPTTSTSRPSTVSTSRQSKTSSMKTSTTTTSTITTSSTTLLTTKIPKSLKQITDKPLMSTTNPTTSTTSSSNKEHTTIPKARNTTQETLTTEQPSTTVEGQQTTDSKKDPSTTVQTQHHISLTMSTLPEVGQDTDSIDIDQPLANGVFIDLMPDSFDAENEQRETLIWENDEN